MIGSHCVAPAAGTLPRATPTWRMKVSSAATARSHDIWSSFPPPTAIPLILAIVGFPMFRRRSNVSMKTPIHL